MSNLSNVVRPDIEVRNRRIMKMYQQGVIRKRIAIRLNLEYDAVKKVIQKYRPILSPVYGIQIS